MLKELEKVENLDAPAMYESFSENIDIIIEREEDVVTAEFLFDKSIVDIVLVRSRDGWSVMNFAINNKWFESIDEAKEKLNEILQ